MTFLNKKEEVIKIELTPYGRHLLSQGKMEPVYYSFFDDSIQYNVDNELNSAVKQRILEDTPYPSPFYSFSSVESSLNTMEISKDTEGVVYPVSDVKSHYMIYPMGTSANTSGQYTPAFKAIYLHGSASTANKVLVSNTATASYSYKNIPQIDSKINYNVSIQNTNDKRPAAGLQFPSPNQPVSRVYPDGTFLQLREEQNLVYIEEKNGFQHNNSYEIEVFLYDEVDESTLVPLKFAKKEPKIVNGMLIDSTSGLNVDLPILTPDMVEYYVDFRVDKIIPTEDICAGIEVLKAKQIYLDLDYECPERIASVDNNVYKTRINPEDIEDCG